MLLGDIRRTRESVENGSDAITTQVETTARIANVVLAVVCLCVVLLTVLTAKVLTRNAD